MMKASSHGSQRLLLLAVLSVALLTGTATGAYCMLSVVCKLHLPRLLPAA